MRVYVGVGGERGDEKQESRRGSANAPLDEESEAPSLDVERGGKLRGVALRSTVTQGGSASLGSLHSHSSRKKLEALRRETHGGRRM